VRLREHTFASLLLQDGVPIAGVPIAVCRQLGHKDASITMRVYAHWVARCVERQTGRRT